MNRKGFQFSFSWLFAVIVGGVVIFLAIYGVTRLVDTGDFERNTIAGAELGILLHPIETNLESGKYNVVNFPEETRIYNSCRNIGNFGRQGISTSIKTGIGNNFGERGVETSFFSKYIFSRSIEEGRELHVFSKPFEMPYKIGDLIFASAEDYCFVEATNEIEDEVEGLEMDFIELVDDVGACSVGSESVCFRTNDCDVNVDFLTNSVEKNGDVVYFVDDLVYGAIFADVELYECQVDRLMKRAGELAQVYAAKSDFLSSKGCSSNLQSDLLTYSGITQISSSIDLSLFVEDFADDLDRRNDALNCRLF